MTSPSNSPVPEELELFDSPDEVDVASSLCLLGKSLASKPLNHNVVLSIIKGAWKVRGELSILPWLENTFLFQFSEEADRNRILRDSPWSAMGSLLVLQTLSTGQTIDEVDFHRCPFWVQAHGLPIQKMTKQNGEIIGNRIGKVINVEAPKDGLFLHCSFLRIRVEINIQNPLSRAIGNQLGYGPDLRTGVARNIVSLVNVAKQSDISPENSRIDLSPNQRRNTGNSPPASMAVHGLGVHTHSTTDEPLQYSSPPHPESCTHTTTYSQISTSGTHNSPLRGLQTEAVCEPTSTPIEAFSGKSLILPILPTKHSLQPFGPLKKASLLNEVTHKPTYFVTEPPESPRILESPKELEPTALPTGLGLTDVTTIL
ncbi:hypothetical protein LOK49_LG05G03660 [Camellia lanceoleosa]|uniref:Uncharacterized protein n=1 Tax=Camellia lanceoleosa TaxID=1840588 RepID=A0ACC0HLJ6_9ERIC|nr:hypothetical protein LOK49_LG05G03660 [Camellia lanceoleosa]